MVKILDRFRTAQGKALQDEANNNLRTPTMEQDPEVVALAKKIYMRWANDERWVLAHLHPPQAPQDYPIAYFWAELAARATLGR